MAPAAPASDPQPSHHLDLRGTPCPVNFIRSKLALEQVPVGAWLELILDDGEPHRLVREGLSADGHVVQAASFAEAGVRLLIRRHGA